MFPRNDENKGFTFVRMVCTYFKIEKSCNACKEVIQKGKTVFYLHFMAMFQET